MKSKAHSKKCMDLGVSVGLIDDQDIEEYGKVFFFCTFYGISLCHLHTLLPLLKPFIM